MKTPQHIHISASDGSGTGHTESACTLAVGPRGDVWTAGDDGTKMWLHRSKRDSHGKAAAPTYSPVDVLEGHGGGILALAVGPNGAVISGSADRTAKLWSLWSAAGAPAGCRGTLTGHGGPVRAVAVCGVNTTVYTASDDCTIVAWRRKGTSFEPQRLVGHTDRINALALGPDGTLYSASDDCTTRVWSGDDGRFIRTLVGHTEPVWDVTVGRNGYVYTAADDALIHVWDGETGRHLHTLEGHTGGVHQVVETSDGAVLSCSDDWPNDPTLRVWNPDTGAAICVIPIKVPVATAPGGSAPATAVALATGSDGRLYALSAKAGSHQYVLVL